MISRDRTVSTRIAVAVASLEGTFTPEQLGVWLTTMDADLEGLSPLGLLAFDKVEEFERACSRKACLGEAPPEQPDASVIEIILAGPRSRLSVRRDLLAEEAVWKDMLRAMRDRTDRLEP